MTILGIRRGYQGLIDGDMIELTSESVLDVHNRGGTVLKTARCLRMKTEEGRLAALESCKRHGIEGLIVIGGDGSYQGAAVMATRGVPTIALPGTIDNDLAYTDSTLGYDTASNTACHAALLVRDTMESHERIGIVEVMGRHCGDIALNVAMATGADYVLVPEVEYADPFDIKNLADRLCALRDRGRTNILIILAEGVGFENTHRAYALREALEAELNRRKVTMGDIRETVLGYQQRGGHPTVYDINLAVLDAADLIVLVLTPDIAAIKNTRLFLTVTDGLHINRQRLLCVMNRYDKRTAISPEKVGENLKQEILSVVPLDEKTAVRSANQGLPFVLDAKNEPITKSMLDLAENVKNRLATLEAAEIGALKIFKQPS
jgi:6-phosphofructokinase 1